MSQRRGKRKGDAGLPKPWTPMTRGTFKPDFLARLRAAGEETDGFRYEVWGNDRYECIVRHNAENGVSHLSIKRYDRRVMRDWRHLQSIKNDVLGPEREACEIFPAEARLTDSANEFHLWALPPGHEFPFGYRERFVVDADVSTSFRVAGQGKARQRPLREQS